MNERPTPETDAEVKDFDAPWLYYVNADFARKLERERDQAQKDLDEERHAWEKEREEWQADYAAVSIENKAMREAIKEAHEVLTTAQSQWAHYAEFRDDEDLETAKHLEGKMYRQGQAALAKLQSFLA